MWKNKELDIVHKRVREKGHLGGILGTTFEGTIFIF